MATQVQGVRTTYRARRIATAGLIAAAATILVGLVLGTTNPWRLVLLDDIAQMRLALGWTLAAIGIALAWSHLPQGAVRISFALLVVVVVLGWSASTYSSEASLLGVPIVAITSRDGSTSAGVIETGFKFADHAVYLQSNEGLISRRVFIPTERSTASEADGPYPTSRYLFGSTAPTLVFTAPDVLEIRSLCGVRTVRFVPGDLTVTEITSDRTTSIDSSSCA